MDYRKTPRELQTALIYSLIVAGKSANFADTATVRLLVELKKRAGEGTPFDQIRRLDNESNESLLLALKKARTGNYRKMDRALREIVHSTIRLDTCGPDQLEQVSGIGPKTARFFIIWTRPNAKYAALDVHILRWLREVAGVEFAPKHTPPSGKLYQRLEHIFIEQAGERGLTPRQLDEQIWLMYSGYNEPTQEIPA